MSLPSHKTILWNLPVKYFQEFGCQGSGPHRKFLFLESKIAEAESVLIYILVTFVLENCCVSEC